MRILTLLSLTAALASCAAPGLALAVSPDAPPVSRAEREQALSDLNRRLDHYVAVERTPAIRAALNQRRAALADVEEPEAFCTAVNDVLSQASHDKHLQLWIEPQEPPVSDAARQAGQAAGEAREAASGFGVVSARRLPAGVAYLKLDHFSGHQGSAAAVDQAMATLSGADVLILDLRDNGGGGEVAQKRLLGHLAPTPMPMMTIEMRRCAPDPKDPEGCIQDGSRDHELRFADAVAAPAFPTQPVYVLTSTRTFSAAEEVAFDLQTAGRAIVVGETTGGGGNPSASMSVGRRFSVIMPIAFARHPVTGGTWEGVGVVPDVTAPADQALAEAYRRALAAQGDHATDPAVALRDIAGL